MVEADSEMLRYVIAKRVREHYPKVVEGLPQDLYDEMIEYGIRSARGYGLTFADDIAGFVLVMFEVGPEFHQHPRIQHVLRDSTIAPEDKLAAMFDRIPDEVWEEVASEIHRQTWFPELRVPDAE
jgi:hypothetical protein